MYLYGLRLRWWQRHGLFFQLLLLVLLLLLLVLFLLLLALFLLLLLFGLALLAALSVFTQQITSDHLSQTMHLRAQ
eukprot:COSAG05_NODE_398_length_10293_cov_11.919176_16_plen_76_part_00